MTGPTPDPADGLGLKSAVESVSLFAKALRQTKERNPEMREASVNASYRDSKVEPQGTAPDEIIAYFEPGGSPSHFEAGRRSDFWMCLGMESYFKHEVVVGLREERDALKDRLAAEVATYEQLRPVWAEGWTSASIAAQSSTAALAQLWSLLGAQNQTQAVAALKELRGEHNG
ncbi:hypothetical protein [Shimia sp.]|uniref:hypothetical protein n=1 Tax=Shimia sp. TaxID=1954381 RepID=UPI0032996075